MRWPPSRRAALATGALIALTATTGAIGLGTLTGTKAESRPPSITDSQPAVIDPFTQKLRDADPCPLINSDALSQFGQPRSTVSPRLHSCQVTIRTADGSDTHLRVVLAKPTESVAGLRGRPEQLADLEIDPEDRVHFEGTTACQRHILRADQPRITLKTFTYDDETVDLCAVTYAATAAAEERLKQAGGITYVPNRTSGYSHARSDACTILDTAALSRFPGLNSMDRSPGFANWSCFWGSHDPLRQVDLHLLLDKPVHGDYGIPTDDIAGKAAFLDSKKGSSLTMRVVHRSTLIATEMFELTVEASLPAEELRALTTDLATIVEKKLPES